MGYVRHHAIIVTSWDRDLLSTARKEAEVYFGRLVSSIVESTTNGYASFFIAPDDNDAKREEYCAWLDSKRYDDGCTALDWVEIQYGDAEGETLIVRDSDERIRAKPRSR